MDGEAPKPQSRPIAALTYLLGFVTGVIFLYLEPYDKDEFVRFHARQSCSSRCCRDRSAELSGSSRA
jgi:hypothetical protein